MPNNPPAPPPPRTETAVKVIGWWARGHSEVIAFIAGGLFTVLVQLLAP